MMSTTNGFLANNDPTNGRAIEAVYSLLSDVEQRLQLVKASLVQPGTFGTTLPSTWTHAGNLPFGLTQGAAGIVPQGIHALVQTPNGLVPEFIPAVSQGSVIPTAQGNFRL